MEGLPATCPPPFSRFDTIEGFLSPSLARNVGWRGFLPTAHPPSHVLTRRQASYSLSTLPHLKREMEGLPATCPPPSHTSTPFLPTCPTLPLLWNTTRRCAEPHRQHTQKYAYMGCIFVCRRNLVPSRGCEHEDTPYGWCIFVSHVPSPHLKHENMPYGGVFSCSEIGRAHV